MYGVFPDIPGQCISVTYPRRNSLGPRDQKRIVLAEWWPRFLERHDNSSGPKANFKIKTCCIECFHSRGQHLCKFIGTKESVCSRKEYTSQKIGLGQKHGRRFIVLGLEYGCRDVMWKHSIVAQLIAHKPVFLSFSIFLKLWSLECKHGRHKTAFRARNVIGTFDKRASHGFI